MFQFERFHDFQDLYQLTNDHLNLPNISKL